MSTRDLARRILREYEAARIEGLTLSGGEPLHQIMEVLRLLRNLKREVAELSIGLFSVTRSRNCSTAVFRLISHRASGCVRRNGGNSNRCSTSPFSAGIISSNPLPIR